MYFFRVFESDYYFQSLQNCCFSFYLYSVILTVCVCVCVSSAAKTHGWILMKFSTNNWTDICEVLFSQILKFPIDDVMAAIFAFFVAALSGSQFCFDFLPNWWEGRKLSSAVCYLKSARSVGNLRQYCGPRFRKKSKWPPKITFLKQDK